MCRIIALIILSVFIFGGWLYSQKAEKAKPEEKTVTMTGIIRNDMVAIGGEITRFVLQKDERDIQQLDHSEVGDLSKYVGKKVKVEGTIYYKEYVERGRTPILKIKKIELLPMPKEQPDELKTTIEELIKKLGDENWEVREKVQKELIKIGKLVINPLVDTIDSTNDPEMKQRSQLILSQLEIELSDDEITQLEKRIEESKDTNKDVLWQVLGKWLGIPVNGLQLTIKLDKKVYTMGSKEVISIEGKLKNVEKEDIWIRKSNDEIAESVWWYEISDGPQGGIQKKEADKRLQPSVPTKDDFLSLRPQKSYLFVGATKWTSAAHLTFNNSRSGYYVSLLLTKPGKYEIKLKYNNEQAGEKFGIKVWTGEVVSNTITIEIKE